MTAMSNIVDDEHEYSLSLPKTTPNGQTVTIQSGERDEVHVMHIESPDQSDLYFEITTYPTLLDHNTLAEEQQAFLRGHCADGRLSDVRHGKLAGHTGTTFDFGGTLGSHWKDRRFLFIDGPRRTYRIVYDPTSDLNEWVLRSLKFGPQSDSHPLNDDRVRTTFGGLLWTLKLVLFCNPPEMGRTRDEPFVGQLQQNFIAYFRLFAGLPGITFTEGEVTWIASQGIPGSLVLSSQLSDSEADQLIDETLRHIGQHTDEVDWFVFPGCQPADLGKRLVARSEAGGPGGEWMLYGNIGGPGGTWMFADLTALLDRPPDPDEFHVKQVADQGMLDEWAEINARGFGSSDYSAFHAAYSRHGFGSDAQAVHFIGYLGDEPVTSATLLMAGGSASVYNVSTPTELRRQGFGSAITHAALKHAHDRGYHSAWIWSSPLGKGVYAKLGFVVTEFGIREYQWKKR